MEPEEPKTLSTPIESFLCLYSRNSQRPILSFSWIHHLSVWYLYWLTLWANALDDHTSCLTPKISFLVWVEPTKTHVLIPDSWHRKTVSLHYIDNGRKGSSLEYSSVHCIVNLQFSARITFLTCPSCGQGLNTTIQFIQLWVFFMTFLLWLYHDFFMTWPTMIFF